VSDALDKRITEWALWYHQTVMQVPRENVAKRLDHLQKSVDGCLELLALAAKDLQFLERRDPLRKLWLPAGMQMNGDVRKLG
jgi:hypothetical protein